MQGGHILDSRQVAGARHFALGGIIGCSSLLVLLAQPIPQDDTYHDFADQRVFLGISGFLNIVSNLGFLIAGLAGIGVCFRKPVGRQRAAWASLFIGISLIAFGSAYYHSAPGKWPLVWDRLPMTIGFMGLLVALLGEYVDDRLCKLLIPALAVGAGSVIYWYLTDDLRLYFLVQALPLMLIPAVILFFRPKYSHQWLLAVSLGIYAFAKATEFYDRLIFAATGEMLSGHTAKHLLASIGCGTIALMLHNRRSLVSLAD